MYQRFSCVGHVVRAKGLLLLVLTVIVCAVRVAHAGRQDSANYVLEADVS